MKDLENAMPEFLNGILVSDAPGVAVVNKTTYLFDRCILEYTWSSQCINDYGHNLGQKIAVGRSIGVMVEGVPQCTSGFIFGFQFCISDRQRVSPTSRGIPFA